MNDNGNGEYEKLRELIDSTSPMMEKFREIAPGTFRHSHNIASICEPIASELKLNPDVMKAAALLHDIGKSFNPQFFTENQEGKNPHDDLDPTCSYSILTKHVSDSVLYLLRFPEVPREVLEIISQHHGTTILQSIYKKAKKLHNGNTVEENYRYKSLKPQSIEAAILMIVDNVEATTKSLFNTGQLTDVPKTVKMCIDKLVADEQLDELKIGVIRVVKDVLIKEIDSIYHKRVSYEDEEKDKE